MVAFPWEHAHTRLPSLLPLFRVSFEYTIQLNTDYREQKKKTVIRGSGADQG